MSKSFVFWTTGLAILFAILSGCVEDNPNHSGEHPVPPLDLSRNSASKIRPDDLQGQTSHLESVSMVDLLYQANLGWHRNYRFVLFSQGFSIPEWEARIWQNCIDRQNIGSEPFYFKTDLQDPSYMTAYGDLDLSDCIQSQYDDSTTNQGIQVEKAVLSGLMQQLLARNDQGELVKLENNTLKDLKRYRLVNWNFSFYFEIQTTSSYSLDGKDYLVNRTFVGKTLVPFDPYSITYENTSPPCILEGKKLINSACSVGQLEDIQTFTSIDGATPEEKRARFFFSNTFVDIAIPEAEPYFTKGATYFDLNNWTGELVYDQNPATPPTFEAINTDGGGMVCGIWGDQNYSTSSEICLNGYSADTTNDGSATN